MFLNKRKTLLVVTLERSKIVSRPIYNTPDNIIKDKMNK